MIASDLQALIARLDKSTPLFEACGAISSELDKTSKVTPTATTTSIAREMVAIYRRREDYLRSKKIEQHGFSEAISYFAAHQGEDVRVVAVETKRFQGYAILDLGMSRILAFPYTLKPQF